MKNFKIAQPRTIDEVTTFLSEGASNCYLMAGGTDLLDEIKNEIIAPEVVVDLTSISDLSYIKKENDGVRIGALTSVTDLAEDPLVKTDYPGLHEAALSLATPQLRHVGTLGGNLCQRPRCWYYRDPLAHCLKKGGSECFAITGRNKYHAILGGGGCYIVYPSDLAPALVSLDAEVIIVSINGNKTIPLEQFYILPQVNVSRENILQPGEILKEIKLPLLYNNEERSTYHKLKERGTWDFALVSAAVKGRVSRGVFRDIKIVLGGVAPIPWRLRKAEGLIKGEKATEQLIRQAVKEDLKEADPLEENEYKKELVESVVYKAALSIL